MFADYILFLSKTLTLAIALVAIVAALAVISSKSKLKHKDKLEIKKLNDKYHDMEKTLQAHTLSKNSYKLYLKEQKKLLKDLEHTRDERKRLFVLNFHGDIRATAIRHLREEITALLTVATPADEIVLRLESPGGVVPGYGLAASQLQRIRDRQIPLTITIDKFAASGGYMMAVVGNKILAAPFAVVGSIGVIAQLPNFHRLLKKNDIDFEQIMAGQYKRTLTVFGENTPEGRQKLQEEINATQRLFTAFVATHRPQVDIVRVATGEHWYGEQALELKLVDALITCDDYLLTASQDSDIYEICYTAKKSVMERLTTSVERSAYHLWSLVARK